MLSFIILVRDARQGAALCLQSILDTVSALGLAADAVEYVLIDDFSDPAGDVVGLFKTLRAGAAPSEVKIVRFTAHRHYAYGLALGLSLARGTHVMFVSHDMVLAPACVQTLLAVAQSDARIGIIRPVSPHMDNAKEHQIAPPARTPLRNTAEVAAFSRYVARYHGVTVAEPPLFIGDAMLITRAVIDRVGVFDTRFRGFMADIDFGVRARRSGFRVVAAPGAWLHHEGAGLRKHVARTTGADAEKQLVHQIESDAAAAWQLFREKWDLSLPVEGKELTTAQIRRLHEAPPAAQFDMRQPPIAIDLEVCEVH